MFAIFTLDFKSYSYCLGTLQETARLCIALACLENVTLLTSVLGSLNNKFLAKESNALASNGLS